VTLMDSDPGRGERSGGELAVADDLVVALAPLLDDVALLDEDLEPELLIARIEELLARTAPSS
jgi:hypothetical protein